MNRCWSLLLILSSLYASFATANETSPTLSLNSIFTLQQPTPTPGPITWRTADPDGGPLVTYPAREAFLLPPTPTPVETPELTALPDGVVLPHIPPRGFNRDRDDTVEDRPDPMFDARGTAVVGGDGLSELSIENEYETLAMTLYVQPVESQGEPLVLHLGPGVSDRFRIQPGLWRFERVMWIPGEPARRTERAPEQPLVGSGRYRLSLTENEERVLIRRLRSRI